MPRQTSKCRNVAHERTSHGDSWGPMCRRPSAWLLHFQGGSSTFKSKWKLVSFVEDQVALQFSCFVPLAGGFPNGEGPDEVGP